MLRCLMFALYYLRALPGSDGHHVYAAAIARADVLLHEQRCAKRRKAKATP
jgi:hypothetical protein